MGDLQDDRESLAELHDYLTGNGELYSTGDQYDYKFDGSPNSNGLPAPGSPMFADDASIAFASPSSMTTAVTTSTATMGTPRPERRRSLPSRVSVASFSSEISALASPPPPGETSFQQRRRRAAKLTHFFGVDYRDLMTEILESIEKGLEEERGKGTLRPDEVKVRPRPELACVLLAPPPQTDLAFCLYPPTPSHSPASSRSPSPPVFARYPSSGSATEASDFEDEAE